MLKHLAPQATHFLLYLYNKVWTEGDFPPAWKIAIILPFLKPSKSGHLPSDYRPIALTSCLCKLLERMVNCRLMWFLESKQLFSFFQFGYRRALSTLDPLIRLESTIRSALAVGDTVIAVFFDLEKAYDTTWRYHILKTLHSRGINGNLGVFIQNFLTDRTFRVRIKDNLSKSFPQYEGVPQGCVLSTTLFLLAINDIVTALPPGVHYSLYVDDLAIYVKGSDIPPLQSLLQSAVMSVSRWASNHGFRFSTAKSCAITFTRKRAIPQPPIYLSPVHTSGHARRSPRRAQVKMTSEAGKPQANYGQTTSLPVVSPPLTSPSLVPAVMIDGHACSCGQGFRLRQQFSITVCLTLGDI